LAVCLGALLLLLLNWGRAKLSRPALRVLADAALLVPAIIALLVQGWESVSQTQAARMNCDGISRYYEVLEHLSFGSYLERRRFAFLEEARTSRRAMVCGGGDGRFLARLLHVNSRVEVDFVELSPKMVELAERRVAGMGRAFRERVRFHVGDVGEFEPRADGYDLIVTHFFLDCFSEPELAGVVAYLASWGADARWMVSDFREAQGRVGRLWTRAVIRGLYAAFRLTTGLRVTRLPDYAAALAREGYRLRYEEQAFGGLLHSSLWEACTSRPGPAPVEGGARIAAAYRQSPQHQAAV
jgi:SAM-dependent methyltransferase